MVHGSGGGYVGNVPNNTRVGIPPINLEDGPQGVADGVSAVTCWPSALTNVMSWNTTAMYLFGQAMAQEQYLKGTNVMLGPGVNIVRRGREGGPSFAPPQTSHTHSTPFHSWSRRPARRGTAATSSTRGRTPTSPAPASPARWPASSPSPASSAASSTSSVSPCRSREVQS
jgi:hypothetical protein